MRLLITGASGLLARVLLPRLQGEMECWPVGGTRRPEHPRGATVDLTERAAVTALLREISPEVVLHLAALADIDACERSPEAAYRNNVLATENLVTAAASLPHTPHFIYVSTDAVYDSAGRNREADVRPRNVYATTKLQGEEVCRVLPAALVLRLNFFCLDRKQRRGLAEALIHRLQQRTPLKLFEDVSFNPLYGEDLAEVVWQLLQHRTVGTFNLGAAGDGLSKAEFARRLAACLGLTTDNCTSASVADAGLAAYRPRGMVMDVSAIEHELGIRLPSVDDGLQALRARWLRAHSGALQAGTSWPIHETER